MSEYILHFEYGSNMDSARLFNRVGEVKSPLRACLKKFRFEFNKLAWNGKTVYGNIVDDDKSVVWGVLMSLNRQQLDELDDNEAVHLGHYRHKDVIVVTDDDVKHPAMTYVAEDEWVKDGLKPTETYRNYVINGAEDFKLPHDYVERIRKL